MLSSAPELVIATRSSLIVWPPPIKARSSYQLPTITNEQNSGLWRTADDYGDFLKSGMLGSRPDIRDVNWFRGRFNGVKVPGIPWFDGNYKEIPEIMMTWFLPAIDRSWWDKYFKVYVQEYGLTHFCLSIPQARNWNFLDDRLIDCAKAATSNGLYVCMNVFGGDGADIDKISDVQPYLDKLVKAKAIHRTCVAWQADQNFDSSDTDSGKTPLDLFNFTLWCGLYASRNGLLNDIHWLRDGAYWADADDSPRAPYSTYTRYGVNNRWNYQYALGLPDSLSENGECYIDRYVRYLGSDYKELSGHKALHCHLMQYYTEAPVNNVQDALVSVFRSTAPVGINVVLAEVEAQAQSFQDPFPPREPYIGDGKGYLGACAYGYGQTTAGYYDGGLYPNGDYL